MANALAVYEEQFALLRPTFQDVMPPGIDASRIMRTVLVSLDRTPKLLECTQSSVMQGALTLAILGLEADGMTGQGYLIPFKDRRAGTKVAQTVIGYKGYNTLGARNGFAIRGGRVYEGDVFDLDLGRPIPIIHKPDIRSPMAGRRLLGCYALAVSNTGLQIPVWLGIDELEAVRAKSPGANMSDSPWNDEKIGRPAMYEKTAKRRLARAMPLSAYVAGGAMEEAHEERGLHSWIDREKGVVIDSPASLVTTQPIEGEQLENLDKPEHVFRIATGDASWREAANEDDWKAKMLTTIQAFTADKQKLARFRELNGPIMADLHSKGFVKHVRDVDAAFTAAATA